MAGPAEAPSAETRLDRPPPDDAYIELPASFGRRFAVFVDTEEEFDWSKPYSRDARSVSAAAAIPVLQERLRAHGVKPIYLVDHPIATDPASVEMLRHFADRGECTIGAQLHPWVNPPFEEELSLFNSFVGNLPITTERAKLRLLTETIDEAFGRPPLVFRAGRYGVGPNTADLLSELGYRADSSARPLFDYSKEGGPDFSRIRPLPYRVGGLVEIPLAAALTGPLGVVGPRLYHAIHRLALARSVGSRLGLLSRVALTPEGMPAAEVAGAVRRLSNEGVRLFPISFHSPSLQPGNTPYVRSDADLERFYAWWESMFAFFDAEGIAPVSLDEILAAAG